MIRRFWALVLSSCLMLGVTACSLALLFGGCSQKVDWTIHGRGWNGNVVGVAS